jgi:hypothetical protein
MSALLSRRLPRDEVAGIRARTYDECGLSAASSDVVLAGYRLHELLEPGIPLTDRGRRPGSVCVVVVACEPDCGRHLDPEAALQAHS